MLIDDIRIFECVLDKENPKSQTLMIWNLNAIWMLLKVPVLTITDNCDLNPKQVFKEVKEVLDACTKKITRTWEITDACGNTATEDQLILSLINRSSVYKRSGKQMGLL